VRGTAIGVYNTPQTLGLFFGGLLGGWLAKHYGAGAVYVSCALLSLLWLVVALGMKPLPAARSSVNELSSLTFTIASGVNLDGLSEALAGVRGVHEAEVLAQARIARLKVVPGQWDEMAVRKMLIGES
jgi:MFS family permease